VTFPGTLGLARVTIAAPHRRVDVTLPEHVPLAELLPSVLRHAGDGLADEGESHGGWVLRRSTGEPLATGLNLHAQQVRDGEVLYLAPGLAQWPEPDYDDLVEAIARGSRRHGRVWSRAATRVTGLTATCAVLSVGLLDLLLTRDSPGLAGGLGLGIAVILTLAGVTLARAAGDAEAGAVVAGCGLPYAFLGGLLVTVPEGEGVDGLGISQLLPASTALVLFSALGYVGVAAMVRLFAAGIVTGLLGVLAAAVGHTGLDPAAVAAVTVTVAIGFMPAFAMLAARLGKLPFPVLPQRAEEMLEDRREPAWADVFAAVARTGEVLTGLLWGATAVAFICVVALLLNSSAAAIALAVTVTAALLLRARLYPLARQRVPLAAGGILSLIGTLVVASVAMSASTRITALAGVLMVGAVVLAAALVYSTRAPTPVMGRLGDIADALSIAALIPITCAVTGFYSFIQGTLALMGG
jgi:type VII secretion integral membrane protein EccD